MHALCQGNWVIVREHHLLLPWMCKASSRDSLTPFSREQRRMLDLKLTTWLTNATDLFFGTILQTNLRSMAAVMGAAGIEHLRWGEQGVFWTSNEDSDLNFDGWLMLYRNRIQTINLELVKKRILACQVIYSYKSIFGGNIKKCSPSRCSVALRKHYATVLPRRKVAIRSTTWPLERQM